ncbi:MAG: hypothetical protein KBE25_05700 [Laribacter sp.]|nr:hypothetical protein [Laribacter sp.]MBP9527782.1 hypothetical protein [Laribacter sp.]MBP9608830.1 hypothetical protein [Laribacter sp.]
MRALFLLSVSTLLAGCNWIGNVTGLNSEANQAIGAGCRQTGRSLEECYIRHPDADRAQIFAGWKQMNEYMSKHELPTMNPPVDPAPPKPEVKKAEAKPTVMQPRQRDPEVEQLMRAIEDGNAKPQSAARVMEKMLIEGNVPVSADSGSSVTLR